MLKRCEVCTLSLVYISLCLLVHICHVLPLSWSYYLTVEIYRHVDTAWIADSDEITILLTWRIYYAQRHREFVNREIFF